MRCKHLTTTGAMKSRTQSSTPCAKGHDVWLAMLSSLFVLMAFLSHVVFLVVTVNCVLQYACHFLPAGGKKKSSFAALFFPLYPCNKVPKKFLLMSLFVCVFPSLFFHVCLLFHWKILLTVVVLFSLGCLFCFITFLFQSNQFLSLLCGFTCV